MTEKTMSKEYIGDSVYADFDGFAIVLTTENGYADDPRNRIVLEKEVYDSLIRYVERLKAESLEQGYIITEAPPITASE